MKPGSSLEKDVQRVYTFLLNMRDEGVVVGNPVFMTGKSGEQHEIDVYYEFTRAGIRHRVAIESARSLLLMPFPGGMIKQRDGGGGIPLRELEQTNPSGESLVTKPRDRSSVPC